MSIFDILKTNYRDHYRNHTSDSPPGSRTSLLNRLRPVMSENSRVTILDIGSGNQSLFSQFRSTKIPFSKDTQMVSIDFAQINGQRSKSKKFGAQHFTADGCHIPFESGVFSIIISNLALSFMGMGVFAEIRRVMQTGGILITNLDHPSIRLLRNKLASLNELTAHQQTQLAIWDQLLTDSSIFESPEEIDRVLRSNGFQVTTIGVGQERQFSIDPSQMHVPTWWEVDAYAI